MTNLLLLDHNEDSEPFLQRIVGENLSNVCFSLICLFSSHAINSVLTLFFKNFPAATGSQCSVSVEHCCLLVNLSEYLVVGFVVCMLEGVHTCHIGLFVSVTRPCAEPALRPSWRWSSASKSVLHKKKRS